MSESNDPRIAIVPAGACREASQVIERAASSLPGEGGSDGFDIEQWAFQSDADARFSDFLLTLPWDSDSKNHNKAYSSFLRAASLGVAPGEATKRVVECITSAGGIVDELDLYRQLTRAYAHVGTEAQSHGSIELRKLEFQPDRLREIARRISVGDPIQMLRDRSPLPPRSTTTVGVLEVLFRPGEKVLFFERQRSQGALYTIGETQRHIFPERGHEGIWFLIQPVDGFKRYVPRLNKKSRRSEECVTRWPHLLLESDKADEGDWGRLLLQLPLPIVAVYRSGGRSVHALLKIDADDKDEWDLIKRRLAPMLVPLGADPGALSAVRLSRLPQCWRGDRQQELLFLNPTSDGTPIIEMINRKEAV